MQLANGTKCCIAGVIFETYSVVRDDINERVRIHAARDKQRKKTAGRNWSAIKQLIYSLRYGIADANVEITGTNCRWRKSGS